MVEPMLCVAIERAAVVEEHRGETAASLVVRGRHGAELAAGRWAFN